MLNSKYKLQVVFNMNDTAYLINSLVSLGEAIKFSLDVFLLVISFNLVIFCAGLSVSLSNTSWDLFEVYCKLIGGVTQITRVS